MLAEILPPQVAVAEAYRDLLDAALFPEEHAALADAVEERKREFATVRACARAALAKLGVSPLPITRGPNGAPQWPSGVVGSMTHCAGYRAAAVARAAEVAAIGLDAEPDRPLPDDVLGVISSVAERIRLRSLAATSPGPSWDCLLFSAKESVYKVWYPLTRQWLGFEEVEVTISPSGGWFAARLLAPGQALNGDKLTGFSGRWLAREGFILTAIAVLQPVN